MLGRVGISARGSSERAAKRLQSARRSWGRERWHGEGAVLYPERREQFADDLGRVIREHALLGHVPATPLLRAGDTVIAMGSCFASELRKHLQLAGLQSKRIWIPEGLNNTYALLDFLSWCVAGSTTGTGFRYDRDKNGKIREWLPTEPPQRCADRLAEAGALVCTIGVAEVWQDKETGDVFWHGVPKQIFDADRHASRLTTVEENATNIRRILDVFRGVNPGAPIVLTLSPVPLKGTFRGISSLSADCVSKSVLRVALDEVMRDDRPGVYYWPSFEIVKWAGVYLSWPAYGLDDGRARHVTRQLVAAIVDAFIEAYYTPDAVAQARAESARRRGRELDPVS